MKDTLNYDDFKIKKIHKAVKEASKIAINHYQYLRKIDNQIANQISNYLENRDIINFLKQANKYDKELVNKVKDLVSERNVIIEGTEITRKQIFEEKFNNASKFTIMLFGRTMAGKSTTIQALMGKDLQIQGNGTPDWTKDIDQYDWNGVRLVDTPGIEGFDENNYEIADNYMEQADLVLMVISDDHIEPNLIERLAGLLKENKPLAIILNIKAGNPKIAFKRPEKVIRQDEVDGHIERIKEYLKKEFKNHHSSQKVSEIPIFPVYVEGAFRSKLALKSTDLSVDNIELYQRIYKCSRIEEVKEYIINTIINDSIIIKTRSAYDSFVYRLEEMEDILRSKVFPLKAQKELLEKRKPQILRDINKNKEKFILDFEFVKEIFDTKIFGLDVFVEKYIDSGAKGNLQKLYEEYLDWEYIRKLIVEYQSNSISEMNNYLLAFEEDLGSDLKIVSESANRNIDYIPSINTSRLKFAKVKKNAAKVIKTVGQTGAGLAPTALLGWAVVNFWNPTGWAAAAAGVGVAIVGGVSGYYSSKEVKKLGEDIEKSGDKDIQSERNNVIKELRRDLLTNYQDLFDKNNEWIKKITNNATSLTADGISLAIKESGIYIEETFILINTLSSIRSEVLIRELSFIFERIIGKEYIKTFKVHRVVRKLGRYIKIGIVPSDNTSKNIFKYAMGENNKHLEILRQNFGQEVINIISFKDSIGNWDENQIIQALGVATLKDSRIIIEDSRKRIVRIKSCTSDEIGLLYGRKKANHYLCENLFRCKIVLEEA